MEVTHSPRGLAPGKNFSPESLAHDFGAGTETAGLGSRTFYDAVRRAESPSASAALRQWKTLFGRACGRDPDRPSDAVGKLARCYGLSTAALKPDALLFALHTYYATVVKLLLGQIMAHTLGRTAPAERILQADTNERLRRETEALVAGRVLDPLEAVDFFGDDPFGWYTAAWSPEVARLIRQLAEAVAEYDGESFPRTREHGGGDLLGSLYQQLFPGRLRHELGEYYTPDWLAEHVLDVAGYSGEPGQRLLDPACGSGTFLLKAIRRVRAWHEASGESSPQTDGEFCRRIFADVAGYDLNPLAVLTAKANYLIAVRDLLPRAGRIEIPVWLCDSILDGPPSAGHPPQRFDYVVGNPPWIAWDNLPEDYRRATRPLWERYGLFSLSGNEARHGGGKKDLSMLMMYAGADRYLKPGGRLAMVVTQTLFQTKGAGDGFRRFRLGPEGDWLEVLRVDDLVALRPFKDATNFTSTILLRRGAPTQYPVPYVKWTPDGEGFRQRQYRAQPIDPSQPGSPWFLQPEEWTTDPSDLVGPSDYTGYLGANTGGANGVYWLEILDRCDDVQHGGGVRVRNLARKSKREIESVEVVIEPHLLYPLVRWADVARFRAVPSAHILLAQDVDTRTGIDAAVMRRDYPRTLEYLGRFERLLRSRAAYKRYQNNKAFYSMYNVGRYTVAPIKVVWRRMDRRINAAVVEPVDDPVLGPRPVVPQETCVLIACDSSAEAHYVCAVLNSSIVGFLVTAHSVCGGKGFGTPGMLDFVKLRRFDPDDPRHQELAACSREAHRMVAEAVAPDLVQHRIDQLAGQLWNLKPGELEIP
ncbi:MAG TPA: N-6 DNA methylase [Thermoguttaceae bacterium]|nr:N-6 DNA methylase [Thermoguttaceae bacterium]